MISISFSSLLLYAISTLFLLSLFIFIKFIKLKRNRADSLTQPSPEEKQNSNLKFEQKRWAPKGVFKWLTFFWSSIQVPFLSLTGLLLLQLLIKSFGPQSWLESSLWLYLQPIFGPFLTIAYGLLFYWVLYRMIVAIERERLERTRDKTLVLAISQVLKISLLSLVALLIAERLGMKTSGILAFGGAGGIITGFAAKDLLANFLGGIMLYFDRPFKIGDWIRSPDKEIEGVVERIGWRLTIIRTFDQRPLYIPNSLFNSISIENPSRMTHRRIHESIGIRYEDFDQLPLILKRIREDLIANPDIDESQTMMVNFNRFSDSSLEFFIYTFTHTTNWQEFHRVKESVLISVANVVEEHGAHIAYPTQTLHIPPPLLPVGPQ